MPARIGQPAPRRLRGCGWTALTILLATALGVSGCTAPHDPGSVASAPAAPSVSSTLTSPRPTASALKRVTTPRAVAHPRTSPAAPVSSVVARSSASAARVAPTRSGAGAVAAVPPALAHPPPAQKPVPLTAASEQVGVVDVTSTLPLQNEIAAGTGMVLTSGGAILTNNHVIRGATSVTVTVVATGAVYQANVLGADPSDDIAVLQVVGAPRLPVARFGDSNTVRVGNAVVGVGNAGGVGGAPSAAPGVVTALHQTITATDANGSNPETLTDVIASNAQIQPGDSGGPLYNSSGYIVGMDSAGGTVGSGEIVAFSIPIDNALSVAGQIERGQSSSRIVIGTPAFLGVTATDASGSQGAQVQDVYAGTPAQAAGLQSGDIITGLGGAPVGSAAALAAALGAHRPGDQVSLSWLIPGLLGYQQQSATVVLAGGPAV